MKNNITDGAKMASAEIKETPKYIKILEEHLRGTSLAINPTPDNNINELLNSARIMPSDEIPEPVVILYLSGNRVFSRGDISVIVGEEKNRKINFLTVVCNNLLRNNRNNWIGTDIKTDIKILYFDMNKSPYYSINTMRSILQGVPSKKNMHFFTLRKLSPSQYIKKILFEIDKNLPDLVCIDGIIDLMKNPNSSAEASQITRVLMKMAEVYNCHITSILHNSAVNNKTWRGYIGRELERKCESVISVKRDQSDFSKSIIEPQYTKNKPFEKIKL